MKISENMVKIMAHLIQEGRLLATQVPSDYRPAVSIYIQKQKEAQKQMEEAE